MRMVEVRPVSTVPVSQRKLTLRRCGVPSGVPTVRGRFAAEVDASASRTRRQAASPSLHGVVIPVVDGLDRRLFLHPARGEAGKLAAGSGPSQRSSRRRLPVGGLARHRLAMATPRRRQAGRTNPIRRLPSSSRALSCHQYGWEPSCRRRQRIAALPVPSL